jgi:hypothetical protein
MALQIKQSLSERTLKTSKSLIEESKEFSLDISIAEVVVTDPGGIVERQVDDIFEIAQTNPSFYYNYYTTITTTDFQYVPTYLSSDSSIATVDSMGHITRVSDGVADIIVDVNGYKKSVEADVGITTAASQTISASFVTDSLGKDATDNIDSRIVGKTLATNGNIFSSQDHTNHVFVRNPDVWCSDIDLTCMSPSNSSANNKKAGTLITPRHVLISAHYPYGVNTKVYFVSQDGNNTVYERTVKSVVEHPDYTPYYPDLTICCLDEDLPATVTPCKVLPTNYSNYLVQIQKGTPPSLRLDQEEKALIGDLYRITTAPNTEYIYFKVPDDDNRLEFYEPIVWLDSGNPCFLILDLGDGPELVLLTVLTNGANGGSGTFVTGFINDLNQMIVDSDTAAGNGGTGYTVTTANLTGFTDFS